MHHLPRDTARAIEHADAEAEVDALMARLPLPAKVRLLTAATTWRLHGDTTIGLSPIVVSDGPAGVRGEVWDEREPSISLPSGTCLAATWDERAARRYGEILAAEARQRGVHVVLGPTINLHRSPLGGRSFEAFSEDPFLTARIGVGYVQGVQSGGVAASPKHFVGNESETERFTIDARIDERTLRELYLAPFEAVVKDAGAWTIMSAYSGVNGATMTEHPMLRSVLKEEWDFDGTVISDWGAVRSVVASATAGQDIVFPGPASPWSEGLQQAVESGSVAEVDIDEKVRRLLVLATRVGVLQSHPHSWPNQCESAPAPEDADLRDLAIAGMVLLRNEHHTLPLLGDSIESLAVIGASADLPRIQGGGSATVMPHSVSSPLAVLRTRLPNAKIRHAVGSPVTDGIVPFARRDVIDPETGLAGVRVRFVDERGAVVHSERRESCHLVWLGNAPAGAPVVEIDTIFTPESTCRTELGFAIEGEAWLWLDGALHHHAAMVPDPEGLGAGLLSPRSSSAPIELAAGTPMRLRLRYRYPSGGEFFAGSLSVGLGTRTPSDARDRMLADAVQAAASSDAAIVVVGTSEQVESEGRDRVDLRLPEWQDELVEAVAAVNPRTIVVVNSGAPVELPWADRVGAIIAAWFPGQAAGDALADVLLGDSEPGGRLPVTWPVALASVPVHEVTPRDGVLEYAEGLHIGYRAWLQRGLRPLYAFGHGLGYTDWSIDTVAVADPGDSDGLHAEGACAVTVANTGTRRGSTVVQVYASRPHSAVERPRRWLVGFRRVTLDPGAHTRIVIDLPSRQFAHWDGKWTWESGTFDIEVGFSAIDIRRTAVISCKADDARQDT
ncbi:MAG: beta-glucosidase [Microbacterium sp.]|uniref:glycoside hydrolase family 3 protein n=1 Tax=Microbacterium sp. TaxID=51671 RepID=UPI0026041077|nr:glycoside hydrolase family 3 C-terminal domain-containing protein [Microbacterium sp.]MDF2560279.1 beta-glucosidase [Microbacterium sp.]